MKFSLRKSILGWGTLFIAFSVAPVYGKIEKVIGIPLNQNTNIAYDVPHSDQPEIILSRSQYALSYNKNRRSLNWVSWKLESENLGDSGRSNNFMIDHELNDYLNEISFPKKAVETNEFMGSCYDRGHQIPSADRTDNVKNNEATFLMSNMLPQTAYLNRTLWAHLENYSRELIRLSQNKLYIIAGPIYDRNYGNIGPDHDIPIPSKNFKIIFILKDNTSAINESTPSIAVIMPNVHQDGTPVVKDYKGECKPISLSSDKNDWKKFVTTINDIENQTGLKFYSLHKTK